jgi:hypothetical protein
MSAIAMSALCQKQTLRGAANSRLLDHFVGQREQLIAAFHQPIQESA